jgi:ribonucleoside-diphosphate reductase alpha chain
MKPTTKTTTGGLKVQRHFTSAGENVYESIDWTTRTSVIKEPDGSIVFEAKDVEVPASWGQLATDILASKYFRRAGVTDPATGQVGPETSARQVVDRIVTTFRRFGEENGYFATKTEARNFEDELRFLLITQRAAFNSPVWFNVGHWHYHGIEKDGDNWAWDMENEQVYEEPNYYARPQGAACFIQRCEDWINGEMGIMDLVSKEARLFKGGSGTGTNFSRVRGRDEPLSSGGKSSGLISFLKILDANAGSVKSGGTTRRAAKMVIVDVDHPDIEEFVEWKWHEERKAKVLLEAGIGLDSSGRPDFNGEAYQTVSGQNSNNSIRVTDAFLKAVEEDADWELKARTDGSVWKTIKARQLWNNVAQSAWECADPGIQYDDTIQKWHTCKNTDRIYATNPCFPAGTRVLTDQGLVAIEDVVARVEAGEGLRVYTSPSTAKDARQLLLGMVASKPSAVMRTGTQDIVKLTFANGVELRCTPNHRLFTVNRGMVPAEELAEDDDVLFAVEDTQFDGEETIPISARFEDYNQSGGTRPIGVVRLPERWTPELGRFLGHLLGDGSVSTTPQASVNLVYSDRAEFEAVGHEHEKLLRSFGLNTRYAEMANGTVQLVVSNKAFVRWLDALGVKAVRAPQKRVPEAIFQAPKETVKAFLQGLFQADGCASESAGNQTRYVGLGSTSEGLLRDVQQLLFGFGVYGQTYAISHTDAASFTYTANDGSVRSYARQPNFDLRISAQHMQHFAARIGFASAAKQRRLRDILAHATRGPYEKPPVSRMVSRVAEGKQQTYNLTEPLYNTYNAGGVVVANCSEFVFLDETSCNLASINLLKFFDEETGFDVDGFRAACRTVFIAQEIGVDLFSYPSRTIAEMTHKTRPLGLGYANLGAMLMCMGLPYGEPEGRAVAAAVTGLMHGEAFLTSAEMAKAKGPFDLYAANRGPMLEVMQMHREAAVKTEATGSPAPDVLAGVTPERWFAPIAQASTKVWQKVLAEGKKHGYRNAQATVLAPTGTIGLLMSCDTTGVEPEFSLVKWKKLAGGGYFQIINESVTRALENLGYSDKEIGEIIEYVLGRKDENGTLVEPGHETVEGAPHLKQKHYAVFDCANRCGEGERFIAAEGHLEMMAAVQPFLSGAISKTVNLPGEVTVDDIKRTYEYGHKLGLKAVALYRDGCKASQPLSSKKAQSSSEKTVLSVSSKEKDGPRWGDMVALPKFTDNLIKREVTVFDPKLNKVKVHMMFREDPRGRLMEIFLAVGRNGSSVYEFCRDLGIAWSKQLRLGLPSKGLALDLLGENGTVAGQTDHPLVKSCLSIKDLVGKIILYEYHAVTDFVDHDLLENYRTGLDYTPPRWEAVAELEEFRRLKEHRKEVPLGDFVEKLGSTDEVDPNEIAAKFMGDAPDCDMCGFKTVRNGACYKCHNCGNSMGCS